MAREPQQHDQERIDPIAPGRPRVAATLSGPPQRQVAALTKAQRVSMDNVPSFTLLVHAAATLKALFAGPFVPLHGTVTLPKSPEAQKAEKKIEVKAAA